MAAICRAFPRKKVLSLWGLALNDTIDNLDPGKSNVIVAHLTLYRNDRSEYYSTVGTLLSALIQRSVAIDEIVLLIDDVFDMYSRLVGSSGALNADERRSRWQAFTSKTNPDGPLRETTYLEQLDLESSTQTLNLLVSWRRQESLSAETIATALQTRLTVFGIKHEWDALERLVRKPRSVRTAYISHPISAYRRGINMQIEDGIDPVWDGAVRECNALPSILGASGNTVAIMPTAIDEMRFRSMKSTAASLTERVPELGPRWPLIAPGISLVAGARELEFTDAEVQHHDLLTRLHPSLSGTPISGELTRFLEGLFFIEIPYRDHLLVANSDDLVVFRPLADHGRLSSGVDHEVRHWWDRVEHGDERTRLVIVHTADDFSQAQSLWEGSADWLSADQKEDAIRRTVADVITLALKILTDNYELEEHEARHVLSGNALAPEHLGGHPEIGTKDQAARVRLVAIADAVDELFRRTLGLTRGRESSQALIIVLEENVKLTARRAEAIVAFLNAETLSGDIVSFATIGDEAASSQSRSLIESRLVLEQVLGASQTEVASAAKVSPSSTKSLARDKAVAWIERLGNAIGQPISRSIER